MPQAKKNTAIADSVIMVIPEHFGFNPEAAMNNYFSEMVTDKSGEVAAAAKAEALALKKMLEQSDIDVFTLPDQEVICPDAVFPNNWLMTDTDQHVIIFPMQPESRRLEVQRDIAKQLSKAGYAGGNLIDLTGWVIEHDYLEGTGSMVLDRANKIAYACLSPRTTRTGLQKFCDHFGYSSVVFNAKDHTGHSIYHTNVSMAVGEDFAVLCIESIDEADLDKILASLNATNKRIIEITPAQMQHYCGNVIQLRNSKGEKFVLMSKTAHDAFSDNQLETLGEYGKLLVCDVPTIERVGGGSVRCMVAENFLGKK